MKKIFCFLFLYIIAILAAIAQQDPQFTFNKQTLLTVNPGFAGNDGLITGIILNRYQWVGIEGAPKTLVFSVGGSTELFGLNSGLGINIISDELGFSKNISVKFDYAYRKKTGIGDLGVGASFGFYNMSVNGSGRWHFPDGDSWGSTDTKFPQENASKLAFDLGFGTFLKSNDYFVSVSVTHVNQPSIILADEARTFLARHYYLAGGYNIKLPDPLFELQPSVYYKTDMVAYQADFTLELLYKKRFSVALDYRINDAIGVLLEFEMNNGLKVGYAYDIMTSALAGYGDGSHEFYLGYSFDLGKNRSKKYKSIRYL